MFFPSFPRSFFFFVFFNAKLWIWKVLRLLVFMGVECGIGKIEKSGVLSV